MDSSRQEYNTSAATQAVQTWKIPTIPLVGELEDKLHDERKIKHMKIKPHANYKTTVKCKFWSLFLRNLIKQIRGGNL